MFEDGTKLEAWTWLLKFTSWKNLQISFAISVQFFREIKIGHKLPIGIWRIIFLKVFFFLKCDLQVANGHAVKKDTLELTDL